MRNNLLNIRKTDMQLHFLSLLLSHIDMENSNMAGHWIGVFMAKGNKTQVDFTENVIPKKWFMKPFVKSYLRKHQKQFVLDLKKALE